MKKGDKVELTEAGYLGYSKGGGAEWNLRKRFDFAIIHYVSENTIGVNMYDKKGDFIGEIGGKKRWYKPYFNIQEVINNLDKIELKLKNNE